MIKASLLRLKQSQHPSGAHRKTQKRDVYPQVKDTQREKQTERGMKKRQNEKKAFWLLIKPKIKPYLHSGAQMESQRDINGNNLREFIINSHTHTWLFRLVINRFIEDWAVSLSFLLCLSSQQQCVFIIIAQPKCLRLCKGHRWGNA